MQTGEAINMIGLKLIILPIILAAKVYIWLFKCLWTILLGLINCLTTSYKPRKTPVRYIEPVKATRERPLNRQKPKRKPNSEQVLKAQQDICKARSIIDHYSEQLDYYRNAETNEWNEQKRIRYSEKRFQIERKLENAFFQIERAERILAAR